jgi:hypothetical protein
LNVAEGREHTSYSSQLTAYSTQLTAHSSQHTAHSSTAALHAAHSTQLTTQQHSTQQITDSSQHSKMFKKDRDLDQRSKTLLKNKEVRNLKSEILRQFNLTEEQLNTLIPNKADITQTKLASRTILYSLNLNNTTTLTPIIFDLAGRNDLHPTIPFLHHFPHCIPCLVVHR